MQCPEDDVDHSTQSLLCTDSLPLPLQQKWMENIVNIACISEKKRFNMDAVCCKLNVH